MLVMRIIVMLVSQGLKNFNRKITQDIIEYLDDNYSEIDCSRGLTEKYGVRIACASRLIRKHCNMGITGYINSKRIDLAKDLLTDSDNRVIDIAYHVGFNNLSYFHRIFRKYTGMTPLEYGRRNARHQMVG